MIYPKPTPDSGLGIHLGSNAWFPLGEVEDRWAPYCQDVRAMGMTWAKVLTAGNNQLSAIRCIDTVVRAGIAPIIRYMWDKTYPVDLTGDLLPNIRSATRAFVDRGVHYFECDNEPNLLDEWRSLDDWHLYDAPEARPSACADWWAAKAGAIVEGGGIPLLVALAPGGHHDDEDFYPRMLQRLKDRNLADLMRQSGLACHNYWLNHPLDFPFDAINQKEHPGWTLQSGKGASNGFLKYKYLHDLFVSIFGFGIPVLTTEGGPRIGDAQDGRYPTVSLDVHRAYVLAQSEHMRTAPEWYFCTGDWLYASKEFGGAVPWEPHAWLSAMRNPREAPIMAALRSRGFVARSAPTPPPVVTGIADELRALFGARFQDLRGKLAVSATAHYATRPESAIRRIIVHHSASPQTTTWQAIATYHVTDPKHLWPGIGYHIGVGADGAVALLNDLTTISYHAGTFATPEDDNADTVGICCLGNYMTETPSTAMLASLDKVRAWLNAHTGRTLGWLGHRDVDKTTLCPGDNLYRKLTAEPMPTNVPEDAIRQAAWAALGIAHNPEAALSKFAAAKGLGRPATQEHDTGGYRWQGFDGGIVAAPIGEWDKCEVVVW
jgi:hypothetical protein